MDTQTENFILFSMKKTQILHKLKIFGIIKIWFGNWIIVSILIICKGIFKKVEDLIIKKANNLEGHCKNLKYFVFYFYNYEYINNNATELRLIKKKITLVK